MRKLTLALPAIPMAVVLYLADEYFFGAIVIAVTALIGLWSIPLLVPFFFAFDYFLGRLTLGIVVRRKEGTSVPWTGVRGWIMRGVQKWFDAVADAMPMVKRKLSPEAAKWARIIGFVFASYFGTAFMTMPAMYLLGQRRYLRLLTAASAAIYAVTFVSKVALVAFVAIELIKAMIGWIM